MSIYIQVSDTPTHGHSLWYVQWRFHTGVLLNIHVDLIVFQAAGLTLVAIGVYAAKYGTGVAAKYVESRLGKPSLVRETSRFSAIESLKHPIKVFKDFLF